MNVFVIRHGETKWSLSGQHTGTTDVPLTDNGRQQAERLRPVLARQTFALVLVSPLQRARETCDLAGLGDGAIIDPSLIEWNYGEYEGLTPQQILAKRPDWLIFRDGCPSGEAPRQVGARVDQVLARAPQHRIAGTAGGHERQAARTNLPSTGRLQARRAGIRSREGSAMTIYAGLKPMALPMRMTALTVLLLGGVAAMGAAPQHASQKDLDECKLQALREAENEQVQRPRGTDFSDMPEIAKCMKAKGYMWVQDVGGVCDALAIVQCFEQPQ